MTSTPIIYRKPLNCASMRNEDGAWELWDQFGSYAPLTCPTGGRYGTCAEAIRAYQAIPDGALVSHSRELDA